MAEQSNHRRAALVVCANDDQWMAYVESKPDLTRRSLFRAEGQSWLAIRYAGSNSTRGYKFHEAVLLDGWQVLHKGVIDDLDRCLTP